MPRVLKATLQSRRGAIRVATTTVFAASLAVLFNSIDALGSATTRLNRLLLDHSTFVTAIAFIAVLVLAVVLYLHIDYQAHKRPLTTEDKTVDYSFRNHVRVVTIPLMVMKWRQFAVSCLALGLAFVTYTGISVSMSKGTLAAPGSLSVTINQKAGTADPNPSYTSVYTVVFSVPISKTSFTSNDITFSGTAVSPQIQSITESAPFNKTTYEVRVQVAGSGTIVPSIAAESVSAENFDNGTNQASTSTDNSVSYNGTYTPNQFVTKWKTDNPGLTASNQLVIYAQPGYTYNHTINWGDGNIQSGITNSPTHTYASPGTYTVTITGLFPKFTAGPDGQKLLVSNSGATIRGNLLMVGLRMLPTLRLSILMHQT